MANKRLTTAQRGLGYEHQKERARLPKPQGDPCPYCHQPMWPEQQLDADHSTPRALGGRLPDRWAHARCNRQHGSLLGHALRRQRNAAQRNSRRW